MTMQDLATTAARERADAIRSGIEAIADALEKIPPLIIAAREAEDWKALGYPSWDEYVKAEFGTHLLKLDRGTRREWTAALKDAGLSDRAIAPVTNVSAMQVSRDSRGVTKVTKTATELGNTVNRANGNLHQIHEMIKDGVKVDPLAQSALQLTVRLVKEIINAGQKEEAL